MTSLRARLLAIPSTALLVLTFATGCSKPAPHDPSGAAGPGAHDKSAPGATLNNPLVTCGARASYERVAAFKCATGETPFSGDLESARTSRKGALKSPKSGHMVDIYEVPCPGGTESVYVDLYGCGTPEPKPGGSAKADAIMALFDAGDFRKVLKECGGVFGGGGDPEAAALCMGIGPASVAMNGEDGAELMGLVCRSMPPLGPKSRVRAEVVAMNLTAMLSKAKEIGMPPQAVARATLSFAEACGVTIEDVEAVRKKHTM